MALHEGVNVIVGDNETGKTTLLEAINLALRGQLNRRPILYELHPLLVNMEAVSEFINSYRTGKPKPPPSVMIEVYFREHKDIAEFRGSNNSSNTDSLGVSLSIMLDESFQYDFQKYVADPSEIRTIPIEYYKVVWETFSGRPLRTGFMPVKTVLIDPTAISNSHSANKYVLEIVRDYLTKLQSVDLALAYRSMRDKFQNDERIGKINEELASKQGIASDKTLSVALDTTTRASWETGVIPHLDTIPLTLVGKGEQNTVKIKLAIEAAGGCDVLLMEEPENHLSHTNLGRLVSHLSDQCQGKQLIISTHSSFVLNKLGINRVMMFNGLSTLTLEELSHETQLFFQRLPGHDTLRLILAKRSILVEGPSDELIVQKGFLQTHGCLPLEKGVEVISVGTSFKRFLEIARHLNLDVSVVRDNDGDPHGKRRAFDEYRTDDNIKVFIDDDANAKTLEPQLINSNGLKRLNKMLEKNFDTEIELEKYMSRNKTDCALKLFTYDGELLIPEYICAAIR